ncbi:MAG TPA: hypothetical protein VGT05_05175 [Patescibacteria group bacterium]|nr:hypothetical protein [Patescibacteria group bacterium]
MNKQQIQTINKYINSDSLKEQIVHALDFPYLQEAVNSFENKEKELIHQFLAGQMNKEELWDKLNILEQDQPPIIFYNLHSLRKALQFMDISPKDTKRITADLLFGYWKAQLLQLPIRFISKIFKMNEKIGFSVAIQANLADEAISDELAREYLKDGYK